MKYVIAMILSFLLTWCAEDLYVTHHFCDILNNSNEEIFIQITKYDIDSYDNKFDAIIDIPESNPIPPHSKLDYRLTQPRKNALHVFWGFKFEFYKDSTETELLGSKYATADSLRKWNWTVTYP